MSKHICVLCDNEATVATKVGAMCAECVKPLDFFAKLAGKENK